MKKFIKTILLLSSVIALYMLHCTEYNNPYLNKNGSKAILKETGIKDGATVSIFSHDSIAVAVYLGEYLSKYTLHVQKNRYWTDTTIFADKFSKTPVFFPISFYDTGSQEIKLTSYRLSGGDSITEVMQLHTTSPLNQSAITMTIGEEVTLHTDPVADDNVLYVWDLNDTIIEKLNPTYKFIAKTIPSSSIDIGKLYVIDNKNNQSPPKFFEIRSGATQPLQLININDNKSNDTIFAPTPSFKLICNVTGAAQIKSYLVNDKNYADKGFKNPDNSFGFYSLLNIDTIAPFVAIIQVTDNLERTIRDTLYIKYVAKTDTTTPPSITITDPKDGFETTQNKIPIEWSVANSSKYPLAAVFVYVNDNIQPGFSKVSDKNFNFNVTLDEGKNDVRCELFEDTTSHGNPLDSKRISVTFNPQSKDTSPPKIVYIKNGDSLLVDSSTLRVPSILLKTRISHVNALSSVYFNDQLIQADAYDLNAYSSTINLVHPFTTIIVKATDIATRSAVDTIHKILYNRKPVISTISAERNFISDSLVKIKISAYDPDSEDKLSIVAFVKNQLKKDTILSFNADSSFHWIPKTTDVGWDTISIRASDPYEKLDTSIYVHVSKSTNDSIPAKWLTNASNIPESLIVDFDTMKVALKKDPNSNLKPFNYKVELTDIHKTILNGTDSSLIYVPQLSDTGDHQLKFSLTDSKGNVDTFYSVIKILQATTGIFFDQASSSGDESVKSAKINVRLTRKMKTPVTVQYTIGGDAGSSDYSLPSVHELTFAPGDTLQTIELSINDDQLAEKDEQIIFQLNPLSSNAFLVKNQSTHTYTIMDNDYATISFATPLANGTLKQSAVACSVNVQFSKRPFGLVDVYCDFDSINSTVASNDCIFLNNSQIITFSPWQTTLISTVHFKTNSNTNLQGKVIAFKLRTENSSVRLGDIRTFKYTIDPKPPTISIENPIQSVNEASTTINITLSANGAILSSDTVYFDIDNSSTAQQYFDYRIQEKSPIIFVPGESRKDIHIDIVKDNLTEPDEKIVINFRRSSGPINGPNSTATVTILKN